MLPLLQQQKLKVKCTTWKATKTAEYIDPRGQQNLILIQPFTRCPLPQSISSDPVLQYLRVPPFRRVNDCSRVCDRWWTVKNIETRCQKDQIYNQTKKPISFQLIWLMATVTQSPLWPQMCNERSSKAILPLGPTLALYPLPHTL